MFSGVSIKCDLFPIVEFATGTFTWPQHLIKTRILSTHVQQCINRNRALGIIRAEKGLENLFGIMRRQILQTASASKTLIDMLIERSKRIMDLTSLKLTILIQIISLHDPLDLLILVSVFTNDGLKKDILTKIYKETNEAK